MRINIVILFLILFSCVSCSSLSKFGGKRQVVFDKYKFNETDLMTYKSVYHRQFVRDGNHCFETEDNREIITVSARNLQYAIKHFYGRLVTYSVKIETNSQGGRSLAMEPTVDTNVSVEIAYCSFDSSGFDSYLYASVRLAN